MRFTLTMLFLLTSISTLAANQGLRLFSDSTHLKDLPKQTIIRLERDILVPAGSKTVYFYEGRSSHHGDQGFLGTSLYNKSFDDQWTFETEKQEPLHGCDIRLRSKPADAKVLKAGTYFETDGSTVSQLSYNWYLSGHRGDELYRVGYGQLSIIVFKIKNSQVSHLRCGAKNVEDLTKGNLRKHLGSVSLFAPPLDAIQ